jgi:glycerate 2-kinase
VHVGPDTLQIADEIMSLSSIRRIVVVGAGKAGAGMAAGLEAALGPEVLASQHVTGWINVPADCVRTLSRITLHAARPAGVNEPTADGVAGCEQILALVSQLTPDDLCICLLSGGGSALLPAPARGITLQDKLAVTRHLSGAGANIQQLNTVRKHLSRIKGGRLARACRAGQLVALIISDVLGDPLDVIASGPTVPDATTAEDALQVLEQFHARAAGISPAVFAALQAARAARDATLPAPACRVINCVIGNNAVAVDAAGAEAERRGYSHAMVAARQLEGDAETIGRHLAAMARHMRNTAGPDCLISGGEPTVTLAPAGQRGLGGRNQQLVLAALQDFLVARSASDQRTDAPLAGALILSGGTDGEDGPTDAAGALVDGPLADAVVARGLDVSDYLRRNDAYHLLASLGALIKTGPTHTNVCDVRVVLVDRHALRGG